jgi:competence protein ComEC
LITVSDTEVQSTGYTDLRQGDVIFAVAKVLPVETNADNATDFNVQDWLLKLDVSARWKVQTMYYHAHREKTEQLTIIQKSRRYVRKNLDLFFEKSPDLAALAKAMILADKTSITAQTKKLYQQTGLSHVLAVSGFHVSMLLLPLWWFMPRFWLNNKRKWLYLSISTALMFFYVLLTDSPASVQRATIMAGFLLVGRLWHFNGPPINMLAFAAILMLAINPATIFDVGFQLSYAAVSSIFLVFKPIEQLISHDLKSSLWYKWLLSSLLFTFIIQAAMFPLTAYYFGEHAHLGPLANLVYLPFLTFLLFPLFIFAISIGPYMPSLIQEKMVAAFDFCYSLIVGFLQWLCEFPIATEQVSPPAIMALLGALCVIISLNYWNYPRIRWRAICIGLVCLNLTTIF